MITSKFVLTGLTCEACAKVAQLKIGKISGVQKVEIKESNGIGEGQLQTDREIAFSEIQQALLGTNYKVQGV